MADFNTDLQNACIDLRTNIFERYVAELAVIKGIMADMEDKTRRDMAGLIGARDYRQYEGDISNDQRGRLLAQIKADCGDVLKRRLLVTGTKSLKDQLNAGLDDLQAMIHRKETEHMAEIVAGLMPEGVKVSVDITKAETDALRRMPLAGLSIADYTQKVIIELYYGIIQAMSLAMADAKTFEGGIKFGLADISRKFATATNRINKLARELVVQASNKSIMDCTAGFKSMKRV